MHLRLPGQLVEAVALEQFGQRVVLGARSLGQLGRLDVHRTVIEQELPPQWSKCKWQFATCVM